LVSTDERLFEHRLWTDRLPAALQDAGRGIVDMPAGSYDPAARLIEMDTVFLEAHEKELALLCLCGHRDEKGC
jgi:hypothetical protein